jgi:hypothetical protein
MIRLFAWRRTKTERVWRHHGTETAMNKVLPTANETWGFWGTIRNDADPAEAWSMAFRAIADATGCCGIGVRDFLDSRYGRHFADDVANRLFEGLPLPRAIGAEVNRWMNWTIDRRTSREIGIPSGLPYLTGFVTHFEILAETAA